MKAVLLVHGGAGRLTREVVNAERERECLAALEQALRAGYDVLKKTASSLDAVEAAVRFLEDCPLFNAGKGACFNAVGKHELDACIMDGPTRRSGAIGAMTNAKNPISVARAVMEKTPHVLLCGKGADEFATLCGAEIVANDYFDTERERVYWQNMQQGGSPVAANKFGTVGAVAVDPKGRLAAATSTGGIVNKLPGRVGDTPIIGAGTYADDLVAVSGTGQGEYFMRYVMGHEIAALVRHQGLAIDAATEFAINEGLEQAEGRGGVIAIDSDGNFSMDFNSEGMYRGYITESGTTSVAIFKE